MTPPLLDLDAGRGRHRTRAQDVLVEATRVLLRFGVQLAPQHVDAQLVLAERGVPSSQLRVEAHHGPVRRLLQWNQDQQPTRGRHRRLAVTGLPKQGRGLGQRLDGELPQPLALHDEPLLERRRLPHVETCQQVATIDVTGFQQRRERGGPGELLEHERIDLHRVGRQRHRVLVDVKRRWHRAPERGQRSPEVGPRLVGFHVGPQQGGELSRRCV